MIFGKTLAAVALSCAALLSCQKKEHPPVTLFNGKDLTGWDTYLGPAFDTLMGKFDSLSAKGLNNDPDKVFSVVQEDGEPALHVSGNGFGGIATKDEFENYHLSLQFKWEVENFTTVKIDPGIAVYCIMPWVRLLLVMETGCARRNFRYRKETAEIIGVSQEVRPTSRLWGSRWNNTFTIQQLNW